MSKIIKKDSSSVIYKQDIMDENGKLNALGTFLLVAATMCAISIVAKFFRENIVDKDKVC